MKKIIPAVFLAAVLFSCKTGSDKGKFTLSGELKNAPGGKIYLEEVFFIQKQPEVLDTGIIKNGKFEVSAIAHEEGLYRLRPENGSASYLFINEGENMTFTGNANDTELTAYHFNGAANSSIKKMMQHSDSIGKLITAKDQLLAELQKSGTSPTDNTFNALS